MHKGAVLLAHFGKEEKRNLLNRFMQLWSGYTGQTGMARLDKITRTHNDDATHAHKPFVVKRTGGGVTTISIVRWMPKRYKRCIGGGQLRSRWGVKWNSDERWWRRQSNFFGAWCLCERILKQNEERILHIVWLWMAGQFLLAIPEGRCSKTTKRYYSRSILLNPRSNQQNHGSSGTGRTVARHS